MWDEGHDLWRVFPDRKFCVKKGIGLLNPFIGSSAGRKFINFGGLRFIRGFDTWHRRSIGGPISTDTWHHRSIGGPISTPN